MTSSDFQSNKSDLFERNQLLKLVFYVRQKRYNNVRLKRDQVFLTLISHRASMMHNLRTPLIILPDYNRRGH